MPDDHLVACSVLLRHFGARITDGVAMSAMRVRWEIDHSTLAMRVKMRKSVLAWLVIVDTLLAGCALASTVEGKVVDELSGQPEAFAQVRVVRDTKLNPVADLETDTQGCFRTVDLGAGEYRIEVSKSNHISMTVSLRVLPDSRVAPVLVRLVRCGVIAGQVTDSAGLPVRGARVFAMVQATEAGPFRPLANLTPGNFAEVDERGQYRLYNLPLGKYAVAVSYRASSSGQLGSGLLFYPNNLQPRLFSVPGGEEFLGVDFVVLPTALYRVGGNVDLPTPDTTFTVGLAVMDQPTLAIATAQTQPDGTFQFEGIPPGSYELFASGPVIGRAGRAALLGPEPKFGRTRVEVGDQNIAGMSVPVEAGRSVQFVLRSAPATQPDTTCPAVAELTLSPVEDWGGLAERSTQVTSGKAQTVNHLAPGRYHLTVTKLGESCYQAQDMVVDLTAPVGTKPLELPVAPAGSIHGRLSGADRPTDFVVTLEARDRGDAEGSTHMAFPDAESRFVFAALRPGPYWIAVQPSAAFKARRSAGPGRALELRVLSGNPTEVELPAPARNDKNP